MKKSIALLLSCVMVLGLLTACGGSKSGSETVEGDGIALKIWAPREDQTDENSWLIQMEKAFEEAHPEYDIIWDNGVCTAGDAATMVTADPAAAANVYLFMNDLRGTLLHADALMQLDGACLEQVRNDVSAAYVNTVTYTDGNVYGFPVAPRSANLMYFNKRSLSEEDVKSLETCLAKGTVAVDVRSSWYLPAFFFAAGGTLFGETGTDAAAGVQFGGDVAISVIHTILDLMEDPNFVVSDAGAEDLKNGTVNAYFGGSWDYADLCGALGEDLGVAVLPTVTINGEPKQLKTYAGSTAIGVNPQAGNCELAMEFAAFLASAESQLLRFRLRNITPAAGALAEHPDVAASAVAAAESETMVRAAVATPDLPEMNPVWGLMSAFGTDLADGIITRDNAAAYVEVIDDQLMGGR